MIKVLMIEDDALLAQLLSDFLSKYAIKVTNYEDPFLGMDALNRKNYDLVILDLSLPGMDGLDICKEIRAKSDIPIIISSARSDTDDKVIGLGLGADDYLPKPYEPKELYARILSVLRRYKKGTDKENDYSFELDKESMVIKFKNKPLSLTKAEYEVLSYLIEHKNCVIPRAELIDNSPSLGEDSESRSLDVLISRIRNKLNDNPKNPTYLHSVRRVGYRLQA